MDITPRHPGCTEYRQRIWQKPFSRRDFLQGTLGVMAVTSTSHSLLLSNRLLDRLGNVHAGETPKDTILVIVQQGGGNDGLNTVVPFTTDSYYAARPTLAIKPDAVLPLTAEVGLNPSLSGLKGIWDSGNLAVVQGVGYPAQDMSHFRSTITWETGDLTGTSTYGWLGRYLDTALGGNSNPLKAISIGYSLPLAFRSTDSATPAVGSLPDFRLVTDSSGTARRETLRAFQQMNADGDRNVTYASIRHTQRTTKAVVGKLQAVPTSYSSMVPYPQTDLATQLQLVAQLIHANLGTRVFWVEQDGYDDHSHEMGDHTQLLTELDGAVSAFYADMKARGWDGKVVVVTWSEFGRRVEENDDHGTDHGTAGPMLVLGGGVKGGVYGSNPLQAPLDNDGNLVYNVDFRSVYSTVLERWMGADARPVFGSSFDALPFL